MDGKMLLKHFFWKHLRQCKRCDLLDRQEKLIEIRSQSRLL
jgi:hypothetical protein